MPISFTRQGRVIASQEELKKYITLKTSITYFRRNNSTGAYETGTTHQFGYARCSELNDTGYDDLSRRMDPEGSGEISALCPDLKGLSSEYFSQYDSANFDHSSVNVYVYPCSLPDPSQCASQQEVNQLMMVSSKLEKFFVSSDKDKPMRELAKRYEARIDVLNTKYRVFELKLNRLIDDTSTMSSPKVSKEFCSSHLELSDSASRNGGHQMHCPSSIIDGPRSFLCSPYLRYSFDATGKTLIMNRSYKGVITVMGEFGGVIKILTAVVFFLYSFYSARKVRSYFSSRIFNLNDNQLKRLEELLARDHQEGFRKNLKGETISHQKVRNKKDEKKEKEKTRTEVRAMMEECVESKFKAAEMMYKMSLLEVLEDVLFEEHDKTLLPLVIMKRFKENHKKQKPLNKANKIKPKKKSKLFRPNKTKNKKGINHSPHYPSSEPKNIGSSVFGQGELPVVSEPEPEAIDNQKNIFRKENLGQGGPSTNPSSSGYDFEAAYQDLKSFRPRTEIKHKIREYILSQVQGYFEKKPYVALIKSYKSIVGLQEERKDSAKNSENIAKKNRKRPIGLKKYLKKTEMNPGEEKVVVHPKDGEDRVWSSNLDDEEEKIQVEENFKQAAFKSSLREQGLKVSSNTEYNFSLLSINSESVQERKLLPENKQILENNFKPKKKVKRARFGVGSPHMLSRGKIHPKNKLSSFSNTVKAMRNIGESGTVALREERSGQNENQQQEL